MQKTVHRAIGAGVAGGGGRALKLFGIRYCFIARRVVFGSDDQWWRQPEDILGVDWRDAWMPRVAPSGEMSKAQKKLHDNGKVNHRTKSKCIKFVLR